MKYGKDLNKQQGTQEPSIGKSREASAYSRSSQRASPTGNTPGFTNEYPAERAAQAKKHKLGQMAAKTRAYLGGRGGS